MLYEVITFQKPAERLSTRPNSDIAGRSEQSAQGTAPEFTHFTIGDGIGS